MPNALGMLILGRSHLTEEFKEIHPKKEIMIELDIEGWAGYEGTSKERKILKQ